MPPKYRTYKCPSSIMITDASMTRLYKYVTGPYPKPDKISPSSLVWFLQYLFELYFSIHP